VAPFPSGSDLLVCGVYRLVVGVDLSAVTNQANPVLEGGACDRERKAVDIAHVDEAVGVALEIRVDPVPSPESLRR